VSGSLQELGDGKRLTPFSGARRASRALSAAAAFFLGAVRRARYIFGRGGTQAPEGAVRRPGAPVKMGL
jgi:hypothetical protein